MGMRYLESICGRCCGGRLRFAVSSNKTHAFTHRADENAFCGVSGSSASRQQSEPLAVLPGAISVTQRAATLSVVFSPHLYYLFLRNIRFLVHVWSAFAAL